MALLFLGVVGALVWIAVLATRLNRLDEVMAAHDQRLERMAEELGELRSQRRAAPASAAQSTPPVVAPSAPPIPERAATAAPSAAPLAIAPPPAIAPRPAEPSAAMFASAPATPAAERNADEWEAAVGANWLNRAGVLVFITGVALLIGYSMTHVGPAGRVGIGYALSVTMLLAGVTLERRDGFRNYAYGLIAGGWAGVYFTTYAMHAVDAAKILDSDVIATALLTAVAAAMVVHSLKYRAQIVTVLAYIVAFATLALTSLTGFALVASVPLALSLIVVAQRFTWPGLSALGVACTYGIFALRGDLSSAGAGGYATLAAYWLLFEAADVYALRRQGLRVSSSAPLFPLNAAGLIGAGVMRVPLASPEALSNFLAVAAIAYLASAVARARWLAPAEGDDDDLTTLAFGTHQGAVIVAAVLITWSMSVRFSGARLALSWLVDAELFFIAGLVLRDRIVRLTGAAVAVFATACAVGIGLDHRGAPIEWLWSVRSSAVVGIGTAIAWYANRELLRWRGLPPVAHEWGFTPAATMLLIIASFSELTGGHPGIAVVVLAAILVEVGLRLGLEYRIQAYVAGVFGALALLVWFVSPDAAGPLPERIDAWQLLPLAAVLGYVSAWRLATLRDAGRPREGIIAAAVSECLGAAFVIVFEWSVLDPQYVGLAWIGTAVLIGGVGLVRKIAGLRWQAYPILLLAFVRVMLPFLSGAGEHSASQMEVASALAAIAVMFAAVVAVRAAIRTGSDGGDIEDAVRIAISLAATAALGLVIFRELRPSLISLTWGLEAAGLLVMGFGARERLMRLSGLAVFLGVIVRLFVYDLQQFEGLARILSFVALGLVLLAASWIYTRYREKIGKHL